MGALPTCTGHRFDELLDYWQQQSTSEQPLRYSPTPSERSLDRLIDYPSADMTITVQAGMTISTLRGMLGAQHQRLLIDAPEPDRATLGGIFATNTTGPRRYGCGRPRDQVVGISFVTSEGAVVKGGGRVVKNVAGYDFPRLLTGSSSGV